jgi:hypothetical protein
VRWINDRTTASEVASLDIMAVDSKDCICLQQLESDSAVDYEMTK